MKQTLNTIFIALFAGGLGLGVFGIFGAVLQHFGVNYGDFMLKIVWLLYSLAMFVGFICCLITQMASTVTSDLCQDIYQAIENENYFNSIQFLTNPNQL